MYIYSIYIYGVTFTFFGFEHKDSQTQTHTHSYLSYMSGSLFVLQLVEFIAKSLAGFVQFLDIGFSQTRMLLMRRVPTSTSSYPAIVPSSSHYYCRWNAMCVYVNFLIYDGSVYLPTNPLGPTSSIRTKLNLRRHGVIFSYLFKQTRKRLA